jgi:ribonuclease BN (tRNA processing enzyme)
MSHRFPFAAAQRFSLKRIPLALSLVLAFIPLPSRIFAAEQNKPTTQIVMLGTGTPRYFPDRSGPATAIVVGDRAYLVDLGPGVVRRAAAAAEKGIAPLDPAKITVAFITHLHSDHTAGYPDLLLIPWIFERKELNVFGPAGTEEMTKHLLAAYRRDIDIRAKGLEHRQPLVVKAHDIKPGVVYTDDRVKVTAFHVPHGDWGPDALGYRFDTPDRSIVISGDTSPGPELEENCRPCDVMIHETYALSAVVPSMPDWNLYRSKYHTSTEQLGEIAARTKPGLLIVYHVSGRGPGPGGRIPDEQLLQEIHKKYSGRVVIGHDLDVY